MRHEWKFQYPIAKVLSAANAKLGFHSTRLDFWKSKKDEVMARIRESGLEVKESLAGAEYSQRRARLR